MKIDAKQPQVIRSPAGQDASATTSRTAATASPTGFSGASDFSPGPSAMPKKLIAPPDFSQEPVDFVSGPPAHVEVPDFSREPVDFVA